MRCFGDDLASGEGDSLVVTKLDRLARSLRDARDIVDELTPRHDDLFGVARSTVYRAIQREQRWQPA